MCELRLHGKFYTLGEDISFFLAEDRIVTGRSCLDGFFCDADSKYSNINEIEGNPDGTLQEMCPKREDMCKAQDWPLPSYEIEGKITIPDESYFIVSCILRHLCQAAKGESISKAKLSAAENILAALKL